MIYWEHIALISGFTVVTIIMLILILLIMKKYSSQHTSPPESITDAERRHIQNEESPHHRSLEGSNKTSYNILFHQSKPFFCWFDYPSLVAQAVENGWSRFLFVCNDHGDETDVDTSWEVFDESIDYMQKIRLNCGLKESTMCVIRAALPLPGPQFANASFPKEAYFEISILPNDEPMENEVCEEKKDESLSDTTKLVEDDLNAKSNSECSNRGVEVHSKRKMIEEVKLGGNKECDEMKLVAIGLTKGGHLPLKFPGCFLGSVGFNSSGAVYLDERKLVAESENEEWRKAGNVIGCGYNPNLKRVFFTVNSQLVYEIHCKTEDFSHPLHPVLASNTHVTVVVNLGQSPFKFEAANSQRTSNPCFVSKRSSSVVAPCYELDSKELFSMGRIDGKWNHWTAKRSNESLTGEFDRMSDNDLFEIVAR